jgi:hypothetical protein
LLDSGESESAGQAHPAKKKPISSFRYVIISFVTVLSRFSEVAFTATPPSLGLEATDRVILLPRPGGENLMIAQA